MMFCLNSKLQTQFKSMEVRNSSFSAFIDLLTPNTYVMVIMSDPDVCKLMDVQLCNLEVIFLTHGWVHCLTGTHDAWGVWRPRVSADISGNAQIHVLQIITHEFVNMLHFWYSIPKWIIVVIH